MNKDKDMDKDARIRTAIDFLETLATRDTEKILASMTDEPAWAFFSQRFDGAEGVKAIIKASSELYEAGSQERTIDSVYCDGESVILKTTLRARTFKGEDYENLYILIIHLDGDKVRLVEEFMDTGYANGKFEGWEMS